MIIMEAFFIVFIWFFVFRLLNSYRFVPFQYHFNSFSQTFFTGFCFGISCSSVLRFVETSYFAGYKLQTVLYMCMRVFQCVVICKRVCVCECIYVFVYVYVYIYMCICICMYIHIYSFLFNFYLTCIQVLHGYFLSTFL